MKDPLIRSLELLAGVTPGPWFESWSSCYFDGGTNVVRAGNAQSGIVVAPMTKTAEQYDNARFIAESPTLVAELCEEVKLARECVYESILFLEKTTEGVTEASERLDAALSAYQALIAKRGGEG